MLILHPRNHNASLAFLREQVLDERLGGNNDTFVQRGSVQEVYAAVFTDRKTLVGNIEVFFPGSKGYDIAIEQ